MLSNGLVLLWKWNFSVTSSFSCEWSVFDTIGSIIVSLHFCLLSNLLCLVPHSVVSSSLCQLPLTALPAYQCSIHAISFSFRKFSAAVKNKVFNNQFGTCKRKLWNKSVSVEDPSLRHSAAQKSSKAELGFGLFCLTTTRVQSSYITTIKI